MTASKISVRTCIGTKIIGFDEIMYCIGEGRYTKIYLDSGASHLCARTLKSYEKLLHEGSFCRTHKSCLVNLDFIKEFRINGERVIILLNDTRLPLAKRKSKLFTQLVYNIYPSV